jgi:hypothetical protein
MRLERLAPLALAALLAGCYGGYAVVSTTVHDHAELDGRGALTAGSGTVLHYSRLGEPVNASGSGKKFIEDLWIQVPNAKPGSAFSLGAPGVSAVYLRDNEGTPVRAAAVTGTLRIKEQTESGLDVALDVTITLPSGERVRLDDVYAFHPRASP